MKVVEQKWQQVKSDCCEAIKQQISRNKTGGWPGKTMDDIPNRARQLYKNISMLFLFPVKGDLLFTNI